MDFDYRSYQALAGDSRRHIDTIQARVRDEHRPLRDDERQTIDVEETAERAASLAAVRAQEVEQSGLRSVVSAGHRLTRPEDSAEIGEFYAFMRTGQIQNTSLSTTDANGGLIIPEPEHAKLVEKARLVDPILADSTTFDLTGDASIMLPVKATQGVAGWAAEAAARSESVEPTFTSSTLVAYEIYSDQRATQQMVDSLPDFPAMMTGWLVADVLETLAVALATGNGSTKCNGAFVSGAYPSQFSGSASGILNTAPLKLLFALPTRYLPTAKWYCASSTLAALGSLSTPSNADIPLVTNVADKWFMYGHEIAICDSAPAIAGAAVPLLFGSMADAYAIGWSRRTSILVDPYTVVPYVKYYALARVGGCPWNTEAMRALRIATV